MSVLPPIAAGLALAVPGIALPGLAGAETLRCTLACEDGSCGPLPLVVETDESQFAAPVSPGEPPRRHVAHVRLGTERFVAQPIRLPDAGISGFFAEDSDGVARLFSRDGEGRVTYTETKPEIPGGRRLTGTCEDPS